MPYLSHKGAIDMILQYPVCLQEVESISRHLEVSKMDQTVKDEQNVQLNELEASITIAILYL